MPGIQKLLAALEVTDHSTGFSYEQSASSYIPGL